LNAETTLVYPVGCRTLADKKSILAEYFTYGFVVKVIAVIVRDDRMGFPCRRKKILVLSFSLVRCNDIDE
jgi:hypothetical protein